MPTSNVQLQRSEMVPSSPECEKKGPSIDITEFPVPNYDKLKAYLDTKSKDDPWSPYATQNVAKGASNNGHK